jgi:group I intron endonuclease
MTPHSVYWIHHPTHTDMFSQGYIGVSIDAGKRFVQHSKSTQNKHFANAIKLYGWDVLVKKQILIADEQYCLMIEEKLRPEKGIGWNIAKGGGKPPINRWNAGTIGVVKAWNKGIPMSEETRLAVSKALKGMKHSPEVYKRQGLNRSGEKNVWFGKKFSDEYRKKLSLAKLGKPSHRKGIKHTQESIERIRAAKLKQGCTLTEEGRKAIALANTGRKHELVTCPHCGKIGGLTAMPRWHFDNCKEK